VKNEVSELEVARLASAFRPNRKPLIAAVVANLALALALLGVPYWRGRVLAADSRLRFAELSCCLMGGQIPERPGLSLPQGDRDQFAAKALSAQTSWPDSCRPALQRLAPEPAIFLWPSVKHAIADQRAAVELTERELAQLATRRKAGLRRVPERPLQALRRLQAATVLLARAGGAESELDNDAIRWTAPPALAMPARLPLTAASDANLDLYSDGSALEALALDGRGVSYLRVNQGKIDRERVRRTSFVRGVVRAGADARIVWAMPDARCAERADRCAGRPLGMSPYEQGASALAEPVWKLAGHPAGRIDRVLAAQASGRVWLLARSSAAGALELMRFDLPERTMPAPGTTAPPPLEPTSRVSVRAEPAQSTDTRAAAPADAAAPGASATPLASAAAARAATQADAAAPGASATPPASATAATPGPLASASASAGAPTDTFTLAAGDATLIEASEVTAVLLAEARPAATGAESETIDVKLAWSDGRPPLQLPAASGTGAWTLGCAPGGTPRLAYGSSTQLRLVELDASGAVRELLQRDERLQKPIHAEDRGLDRVRLLCDAERTQLLWANDAHELWIAACSAGSCDAPRKLATATATFSAVLTAEGSVLALSSPGDEVRIQQLNARGEPNGASYVPAACFEPMSGMCGTPQLVADPHRLVLTARDRSDLLALESTDGGASFVTLSGVVSAARIEQSTTSPLEQHRVRKGLN
jgi:hypothetical protein